MQLILPEAGWGMLTQFGCGKTNHHLMNGEKTIKGGQISNEQYRRESLPIKQVLPTYCFYIFLAFFYLSPALIFFLYSYILICFTSSFRIQRPGYEMSMSFSQPLNFFLALSLYWTFSVPESRCNLPQGF